MKKSHKIYVILACILLIGWPVWEFGKFIFDWQYHNPIAYMNTRSEASAHLKDAHPDCFVAYLDYVSHRNGYAATISHKTDKDFSFQIEFFEGKLDCQDPNCWPTIEKADLRYREEAPLLLSTTFLEGTWGGSIDTWKDDLLYSTLTEDVYLHYAKERGEIFYELTCTDLSTEHIADILLETKSVMDEAGLPFASCSVHLVLPQELQEKGKSHRSYVNKFPYELFEREDFVFQVKYWQKNRS